MGANIRTAPERLRSLLPWINGADDDPGPALDAFLFACMEAWGDGTELACSVGPGAFTLRQNAELRRDFLNVLEAAEGKSVRWQRLPSLKFMARRRRKSTKLSNMDTVKRRDHLGPGGFSFTLHGRRRDVLLYAFLRTLTEGGMVQLLRCPAPAPYEDESTCGKYLIPGGRRGRPTDYCSEACRKRAARRSAKHKRRNRHG